MFEIQGKYAKALITTDNIEEEAISQITEMVNNWAVDGVNDGIVIMPDCHAGKGCVIGTTMKIKDRIVPNLVGVDIGCGVLAIEVPTNEIDLEKLDKAIHKVVPSGTSVHDKQVTHPFINEKWFERFSTKLESKQIDRALKSIGTLGGGRDIKVRASFVG